MVQSCLLLSPRIVQPGSLPRSLSQCAALSSLAAFCLIGVLGAQGRWVLRSSSSNPSYTTFGSGCAGVRGNLLFPIANILGVGQWTVKIPIEFAGKTFYFAGKTFYNPGIVFDAKANTLGLILSNGGQAIVGG